MASPFTEMEWYTILFSLVVFGLFTLHGLIQERYVHTTAKTSKKDLRSHSSFESTCRPLLKTDFMQHGLSRIQLECVAHNLTCILPLLRLKPHHLDWIRLQTQGWKCMCVFVMDLLFSGFELVFIIIAFTIMCLFGLAAVYIHNTDHQDDYIQTEQKIKQQKNKSKKKRVVTKTNQDMNTQT